jgi:glutathione S-transferase
MITVHHLSASRSHRVVWLCEELELPYLIERHQRDVVTRLAPSAYRTLHPLGTAPVITDGDLALAESGAIVTYLIEMYGNGQLALTPEALDYTQFLFWFHFADGSMMPNLTVVRMVLRLSHGSHDLETLVLNDPIFKALKDRNTCSFDLVEKRLAEAPFFAGAKFTAADIMMFFPLATMGPLSGVALDGYPNLRKYLERVSARPAYLKATAKAVD